MNDQNGLNKGSGRVSFFINSYYKNDVLPPKIFVKRIILNDIVLVLCQIYKFRS
jgi:hypothetical protein